MVLFAMIINKSQGRSPKILIYTSQRCVCTCFVIRYVKDYFKSRDEGINHQ